MRSILKRISPVSKLDRRIKELAHIHFELDEPAFLINKKFEAVLHSTQNSNRFSAYSIHSCKMCGNAEISSFAKFCRICGSEF